MGFASKESAIRTFKGSSNETHKRSITTENESTSFELDTGINSMVELLLANGPCAMTAAKKLVADVAGVPLTDELVAETSRRIAEIRGSEEGREGLSAFLQKRSAAWIGK